MAERDWADEKAGADMRISYSDDEQYPGQFELWQANCDRSLAGKKGQAALRELEQALIALSNKRLIIYQLEDAEGEVCPIGALMKYRGLSQDTIKADPECEMEEVGVELGMPRLVAWKIVELNDIELDMHWIKGLASVSEGNRRVEYTPEERYERVLAWVRQRIRTEVA